MGLGLGCEVEVVMPLYNQSFYSFSPERSQTNN